MGVINELLKLARKYLEKNEQVEYNVFRLSAFAGVAQLVRASGCGPEGRAFDPHLPPHNEINILRV